MNTEFNDYEEYDFEQDAESYYDDHIQYEREQKEIREKKRCPKCNGTNIWYHPENENWNEFYYCPKCEIDIDSNEYMPYEVDEYGNLYNNSDYYHGIIYFEFGEAPEKIFLSNYYPELAQIMIALNLENPTTTQAFSVHEQHVKPLRDLLNRILEEIEKENK